MPSYDVLVVGEINPDLILSGADLEPHFGQHETLLQDAELAIGSSAVIFACGAARLGLRVRFCGTVGDDLLGHYMLQALTNHGVDVAPVIIDINYKTGLSVILNRGTDRAILTYLGAMDGLAAQQINDDLLRSVRHLHVASYFLQKRLQPGLPALFRRARTCGLTLSLDTNWDPAEQWIGVEDILGLIDVFLPNQAEAIAITQAQNLHSALHNLARQVENVAVKLGSQGALAQRGEMWMQVEPPPVAVVDTVGAGDSFDAGFIYGFLKGWSLEKTLKLAVTCGAFSTRGAGGTAAQSDLQEAEIILNSLKIKSW